MRRSVWLVILLLLIAALVGGPVWAKDNVNQRMVKAAQIVPSDPDVKVEPSSLVLASGQPGTFTWTMSVRPGTEGGGPATVTNDSGFSFTGAPATIRVEEPPSLNTTFSWPQPSNCNPVSGTATTALGQILQVPLLAGIWRINVGTILAGQQSQVAITISGK